MNSNNKTILEELTGYSSSELDECKQGTKLLGLGLELTRKCNLKCIYCYAGSGKALQNELTYDELTSVIDQSISLGVNKIGLIGGGEPLLFKELQKIIMYISRYPNVKISVFTNGTLINNNWIDFFSKYNVAIVHKLNSLEEEIQDTLSGVKGSFKKIQNSINLFLQHNYNREHSFSVETVVLKQNITQIPKIWKWARINGINPVVERLTPQGRGSLACLHCNPKENRKLFEALSEIDSNEFSYTWLPRPPIAGFKGCMHHLYAIYIKSDGTIQPCSGVTLPIGNIKEITIAEAIRSKQIIEIRNVFNNIKGKCKTCEFNLYCYGCRGAAYQMHNDYLAEDPFCWKE